MTSTKTLRLSAALVCILGFGAGSRAQTPVPLPAGPVLAGVIESIEFRGARRVPQDTLRSLLASKLGERTSEETLRRDFTTLWNTMRFDDIRVETVRSDRGGVVVRFTVTERTVDRARNGAAPPASTAEVLDRFERR